MSTPYAGTEGHSGTDTSEQRAKRNKTSAKRRQQQMLAYLGRCEHNGATVVDVKRAASLIKADGWIDDVFEHHGTASGTLSVLHRSGQIARLTETRNDAHVYVLPEHIDNRPYERFIGNRERAQIAILDDAISILEDKRNDYAPVDRLGIDIAIMHLRQMIQGLLL